MADAWDPSAFGLTPTAPLVVPGVTMPAAPPASPGAPAPIEVSPAAPAAADDPFAASSFGLTPAAPPPDPGRRVYDEFDPKTGQWIGESDEGYQSANSRLRQGEGVKGGALPTAEQPPAARRTGVVANLAAGANAAIAGTAGLPVDLMTGGVNIAIRGVNAAAGTAIPPITNPVGGSESIRRAMGVVGANPDDVAPADTGEAVARGVGGGLVGAAIPAGLTAGLVRGGLMAAPTAARVLTAAGDLTPQNALLNAAAGAGGEVASESVPDEYAAWKPIAGMAGGLAAVLPAAGVSAIGQAAVRGARDFVAPLTGRVNPLLDLAGNPILDASGQPLTSLTGGPLEAKPGQVALAGDRLRSSITDPEAARVALAAPPAGIAGDQPTTAQLLGDPRTLAAERGVSRSAAAQGPFLERAALQNDARVGEVRAVGAGGEASALPAEVQRQAADQDAALAAHVAGAETGAASDVEAAQAAAAARLAGTQSSIEGTRVTANDAADRRLGRVGDLVAQARARIGGDLPAGSESRVGRALRAPVQAAQESARAERTELFAAVDPGNTLALPVSSIRDGLREILGERTEDAAPIVGEERAIYDRILSWPDVRRFQNVREMRTRIGDEIRKQGNPQTGNASAERRLTILQREVDAALNDAAAGEGAEVAPRPAPAAGAAEGGTGAAPSVGTRVFTPSGAPVDVRYVLREASDLVPSQLPDGRNNPAYPADLQPRDRTKPASEFQVRDIANKLIPEKLGGSASTAEGAPIVGPEGYVESGNGRTMALQRAYETGGPRIDAYRQWLEAQGHDTSGFRQPVLVRERLTPMTPEERVAFARDAGTSPVLSTSAGERAVIDADHLSDGALQQLRPGAVTDPANRDFVRAFMRDAVEPGGEGGFVAGDGALSKEGAARVEAALIARAYGDKGLTAALAETTDPTARVLAGSLRDAAGPMARLRSGIDAGVVDPAVDLAPALVEATQVVQVARGRGISLADAVAQQDAFSRISPEALAVLHAAYGEALSGQMSRSTMTKLLEAYAEEAEKQATTASLFGANLSSGEILGQVAKRYGKGSGEAGVTSGNAVRARSGDGEGGGLGEQSGNAAAGPAPSGGGQGGAGNASGARLLPDEALTPNYDPEALARLRDANARHVADLQRFRQAPGVGQMLKRGPNEGFASPAYDVPNLIVRVGPAGADTARAYLAAGGSPEALVDAAAYSLRTAARRPDGSLDPADVARWMEQRQGFLSVIPDAAARFGQAGEAQRALDVAMAAEVAARKAGQTADTRALKAATSDAERAVKEATATAKATVDEAMARRALAVRQRQSSVLGQFAPGADPVAIVGSILRDDRLGQAKMAQLAGAVRGNPDAEAGLRRAIGDYILSRLRGNKIGAGGEETALRGDQFQTLIRLRDPVLREALSDDEMRALHRVADSLARSDLSVSGSKLPGGSDTTQIAAAGASSVPSTFLAALRSKVSAATPLAAAGAGAFLGGPTGAALGFLGSVSAQAVQAAREAGMRTVDDIYANALLNPQLASVLLARVTPANRDSLGRAFVSQLRRASLVGAEQGNADRPPAPPDNALLH